MIGAGFRRRRSSVGDGRGDFVVNRGPSVPVLVVEKERERVVVIAAIGADDDDGSA